MDTAHGEPEDQEYPCGSCFVGVGQPCLTKSGRVTAPHRFRLADGVAFTVVCPTCGQAPMQPCLSRNGKFVSYHHHRYLSARADGELPAPYVRRSAADAERDQRMHELFQSVGPAQAAQQLQVSVRTIYRGEERYRRRLNAAGNESETARGISFYGPVRGI